jgi:hypothetical protein
VTGGPRGDSGPSSFRARSAALRQSQITLETLLRSDPRNSEAHLTTTPSTQICRSNGHRQHASLRPVSLICRSGVGQMSSEVTTAIPVDRLATAVGSMEGQSVVVMTFRHEPQRSFACARLAISRAQADRLRGDLNRLLESSEPPGDMGHG